MIFFIYAVYFKHFFTTFFGGNNYLLAPNEDVALIQSNLIEFEDMDNNNNDHHSSGHTFEGLPCHEKITLVLLTNKGLPIVCKLSN